MREPYSRLNTAFSAPKTVSVPRQEPNIDCTAMKKSEPWLFVV